MEVPLHLMYNSQLKNRISFTVSEEDKFAQKSAECYHGFAQIYTNMVTRKLVQRDEGGQRKTAYEEKEERVLLCELLINIPKTITDTPRPVVRAKFSFKSNGKNFRKFNVLLKEKATVLLLCLLITF